MLAYRIYWFDQDDHVTEADFLIADTDDDVRARAAVYRGTASAVEVWHRARRLVRVTAPSSSADGSRSLSRTGTV